MKYGENFTLKYISKENGKILFDVIDGMGNNLLLKGSMNDLKKILYYSDDLSVDMDFNALQNGIFINPILFIAKRRKLTDMNELDFNL